MIGRRGVSRKKHLSGKAVSDYIRNDGKDENISVRVSRTLS